MVSLLKRAIMPVATMMCTCKKCPSYPSCKEGCDPILYCARGKSSRTIKKKGCICKECPIYKMKKLKGLYFCTTGKAKK